MQRHDTPAAMLEQALQLAELSTPCFPCLASKAPACRSGFKAATANPDELRQLWRTSPGALVGVPTGEPSGFFVLDIDSPRHPEAAAWLTRNESRLPDTRRHHTRSGGLHLLFQHRTGLESTASRLALGVDTRYVIWWPASGLDVEHRAALAPVPDWLWAVLNPPPPLLSSGLFSLGGPPDFSAAAPSRLQGIIALVASAREGERNRLTFWAACRIHDMLIDRELDHTTGANALAALAEAASRTGLSPLEIRRTIASAARSA